MNCKPNELAVVVRDTGHGLELLGRICTTLRLAPAGTFRLPDGYRSHGADKDAPAWVVEFANPIKAPLGEAGVVTGWRETRFAVIDDAALRPIRGNEEPEADSTTTDKPTEVAA